MKQAQTRQYDEDVTGDVTEECLLSFPRDENFFISTEDALPWREPDGEDDGERMVIATVWIESLLRNVPVPSSPSLRDVPFLTRTPAATWIAAALSELVNNAGLLVTDDEDDANVRAFASMDELQEHCDATLLRHLPHPTLTMDNEDHWDNTERTRERRRELAGQSYVGSAYGQDQKPAGVRRPSEDIILKMDTLEEIMRDVIGQPATLVREMERLGDAILPGDNAHKMVFWKLSDINKELKHSYSDAVREQRAGGKDSAQIMQKLIELITPTPEAKGQGDSTPGTGGRGDDTDTSISAPRRGQ
ncbi:MAG: hypothetical protein SGPRY_009797, partial [Prymnesium sp.]